MKEEVIRVFPKIDNNFIEYDRYWNSYNIAENKDEVIPFTFSGEEVSLIGNCFLELYQELMTENKVLTFELEKTITTISKENRVISFKDLQHIKGKY